MIITAKRIFTKISWGITTYINRGCKFSKTFKCYLLEKTKDTIKLQVEILDENWSKVRLKKFFFSITKIEGEREDRNTQWTVFKFQLKRLEAENERTKEGGAGRVSSVPDASNAIDLKFGSIKKFWDMLLVACKKLPPVGLT